MYNIFKIFVYFHEIELFLCTKLILSKKQIDNQTTGMLFTKLIILHKKVKSIQSYALDFLLMFNI
jgi:hypothetical protein